MQKSLKDEIKHLEKMLIEKPNSILFARLADCYMQMGRLDEAIELCEHGVRVHPNYISGHFVLGKSYFRKKLFDLAEKELKRVVVLDAKFIAAYRELGELMAQNGWQNACETNFEEILRIDPLNERAKQRLAMLKQQFALNEKMQTPTEDVAFQPEKGDKSILNESVLSEEHDTLFDLEETEPPPQKTAEPAEPPVTAFNESDEKELGLLEDIFSDENVSDLDTEPPFQLAEDQEPSPFEETRTEPTAPQAEPPQKASAPRITEPEKTSGEPVVEQTDEFQPEYDPFYELQKQRELESKEIEDSLFPFDSKQPKTPAPGQKKTKPASESELSQPMPAREERPPVSEPEKPRPSTKGSLATPTLGEIYAAQRQYTKAIGVYEQLLRKDPNNDLYQQKIAMLRKKMEEEASQ
ncbi:MAG: tetratricopeptide repeat protein [Calditrichaeota bacterium]|nr:tetratricopeptide repeat protein [Calditrichota bacterium]